MVLILHEIPPSPPVRAVKLCLAELGLEAEYRPYDLVKGEQFKQDFLKINPQHTVPTLEDGDFFVWDSHAINGYLVNTYGKNDSLYPKDPKVRALVDQRLHFDSGILFPALRDLSMKLIFKRLKVAPEEDYQRIRDAYALFEKFLDGRKFACGDSFNIADFSIYTTVTGLLIFLPEENNYPNIKKYLETCKRSFKGIESDEIGLQIYKNILTESTA